MLGRSLKVADLKSGRHVIRLGQARRERLAGHVLDQRVVQRKLEVVRRDLGRVLLGSFQAGVRPDCQPSMNLPLGPGPWTTAGAVVGEREPPLASCGGRAAVGWAESRSSGPGPTPPGMR